MEPLSNNGHFGTSHFVPYGRLSSFRRLKMYCTCIYAFGDIESVLCREVVPFSEDLYYRFSSVLTSGRLVEKSGLLYLMVMSILSVADTFNRSHIVSNFTYSNNCQ